MRNGHKSRSLGLVAAGLFGMALYNIAVLVGGPALLARDSVHGMWIGLCIGLELVGLMALARSRSRRPS